MERQTIELIKPSAGHWLLREDEDGTRLFYRAVMNGNADDYQECTDAEKTEWEEAHKPIDPPEPPHIEDTQAEVVE